MGKSILNKIKDNYFILVFIILISSGILYSTLTLYNSLKYWNVVYEGKIDDVNLIYSKGASTDETGVYYYKYRIITVDNQSFISSNNIKEEFFVGDKVLINQKGKYIAKILKVNDEKKASKMGLKETLSLFFILTLLVILIIKFRK